MNSLVQKFVRWALNRGAQNEIANRWAGKGVTRLSAGRRGSKFAFGTRGGAQAASGRLAKFLIAGLLTASSQPSEAVAEETANRPPPFRLLRYEENYQYLENSSTALSPWERMKFIALDGRQGDDVFMSLGGEIRYQYVEKWDDQFGRIPGAQGSLQQRYLLNADFVWGRHFRFFSQLISAWEHGKKPASLPIDVDRLDAQQLFGELALNPEAPRDNYLRVGRQEIALAGHQLLKVREGPNVRLAFDGARLHLNHQQFDADAFVTNVVQPKPGTFDNSWTDDTVVFSGANVGWHPGPTGWLNLRADAFAFEYRNRFVRYEQASGPEDRQTYGVRVSGRHGPWDIDYEASIQRGSLGAYDIKAWGAALFTGYHWDEQLLQPKLTFGLSSVTGDRNRNDHELNTFNCLFARGDYFGDTSLLTGSNTLDLSLAADCALTPRLHVTGQWDRLWRSETSDGLYAPPLIYIRDGRVSNSRDIGNQFTLTTTFVANHFLTLQVIGTAFVAGDFIKAGPTTKGTEGITFRTQFKF